jgi:hypothetical protein
MRTLWWAGGIETVGDLRRASRFSVFQLFDAVHSCCVEKRWAVLNSNAAVDRWEIIRNPAAEVRESAAIR